MLQGKIPLLTLKAIFHCLFFILHCNSLFKGEDGEKESRMKQVRKWTESDVKTDTVYVTLSH